MKKEGLVTDKNTIALQMAKDELSSWKNTVTNYYSSRNDATKVIRSVNAALASMNSFSNGTSTSQETTNALNSAINACDSAIRSLDIRGSDSGFVRDVSKLKRILQKAKGAISNIRHSEDDETAADMVMDLFFLEHGDDTIGEYVG